MDDLRTRIREGMVVRASDGEKLGKVKSTLGGDEFIIEKGLLFKDDYTARLSHIIDIRDDEIIYQRVAVEAGEQPLAGTSADDRGAPPERRSGAAGEEVRIPLAEEQLIVEKQAKQQGAVRVHTEVISEQKQVTVPVTREEIVVERVPVNEARPAAGDAFAERDIEVPLTEEEVRVRKRPVVREEVRVRKQPVQEQRTASAEVRRQEAHVDDSDARRERRADIEVDEGDVRRAPSDDDDVKKL